MTHRLELYRRAVQHPEAEVRFLLETYAHYRGTYPMSLREDFAGTAAVASAWAAFADHHRAVAVESHRPTLQWSKRQPGAQRVTFVHDDVMRVTRPRADVIAALNFSVCEWHDRTALLSYLRHARGCLKPDGLLVVDLFGGPGAMKLGTQTRRIRCDNGRTFEYQWEQRAFDHVTGRIDCRIHFRIGHRLLRNAFRYDWRLWTPPEMVQAMIEAGFTAAEVWCDANEEQEGSEYRPRRRMAAREDFVAYVVGVR